ncbi:family 43 glycosylhydrolase [Blastococcus sp. PRF04-17]|uniref:family 43 glycosylhydrolase n=1 Tax=Blastococcus sp. PRF04-17 TaxID=2933797 RepID=UPI001FF11485|nr:family 43 glycosylhydrolase [Blastococcus sp. PRF04-17]UOY02422.1 family 43 glycosylhydrolase [Blastococcus sp. PRF04-17]
MQAIGRYDFAGLELEDLYRPIIPDPAPGYADQGDPYLLTVPASSGSEYGHYLYHTDVSPEGDRIPVYGSHDLRTFDHLGPALRTDAPLSEHWAPCVVFHEATRQYHMFYSRSRPNQPNADVGQRLRRAVADRPEGPFVDQGSSPCSSRPISPSMPTSTRGTTATPGRRPTFSPTSWSSGTRSGWASGSSRSASAPT